MLKTFFVSSHVVQKHKTEKLATKETINHLVYSSPKIIVLLLGLLFVRKGFDRVNK